MNDEDVPISSKLLPLDPIIDDGLIKVGGRLWQSKLPEEVKHQIILPEKTHFTTLILQHYHQQTLHGPPMTTLYALRQRYWVINARTQI